MNKKLLIQSIAMVAISASSLSSFARTHGPAHGRTTEVSGEVVVAVEANITGASDCESTVCCSCLHQKQ
jgi:Na+/H+-translocating membrane pyrophosphatase